MEFIKAFLLFLLFVAVMGIVLFITLYVVYLSILSLVALKRKALKQTPYYIKPIKPNKKIIKIATVIYILSCLVFYISRVNTYLLSDRPYKEAKAYAIAGEYLQIYQVAIGSFKTADTFYYKFLQYLQREFVLKNIYRFIPETDSEREIWNYKFNLNTYARAYYAPITDEDKKKGFTYALPNVTFKPEFIPLFNNMYNTMTNLSDLSIKDEEFNRFERYLYISVMLPYYTEYHKRQVDLKFEGWDNHNVFIEFFTTPKYIEQFNKFIEIVDSTKEAIEKDEELALRWEDMPNTKAFFYWGAVDGYMKAFYKIIIVNNKTPCNTKEIKQYVKYKDEFLSWVEDRYSSFNRKLDRKRKNQYIFIIDDADETMHYIAKYVCGETFNALARYEQWAIKNGRTTKDKLREFYHYNTTNTSRGVKSDKYVRKIVELNKNSSIKGEEDGR